MTKVRFSGFPTGQEVSISALQGSVARGPVTINAWKQPSSPGDAAFKVYAEYGSGSEGALTGREILPGSVIEMVNHGGLFLYYDDFTGFSTSDPRRLAFETDFGERYDAEFLTDPYLPVGFTTPATTGATLGIYPGFTCGHAFRGTDMAGNQVLDKDHQEAALPAGVTDRTVTCWVSDGVTSAQITFTVRLIDPLRYYTDLTKSTYGTNAYAFGHTEDRGGVFVISQDGDFTGAPVGTAAGQVFHVTMTDGRFGPGFPQGNTLDGVCVDSFTGSPASGLFDWADRPTIATLWKRGETYYPLQGNTSDMSIPGGPNSLMAAWGSDSARPIMAAAEDWDRDNAFPERFFEALISVDANGPGDGRRMFGLEVAASDYDPSSEVWREWWNVLPYTGKTGTIGPMTSGDARDYNGDLLTNQTSSAYTIVIADNDNGDGTGTLLVRQIVTENTGKNGVRTTFADGDVLTGPTGTVTLAFDGSERQDRGQKAPPTILKGSNNAVDDGAKGNCIDNCVLRGGLAGADAFGPWFVVSDTIIKNCWFYGYFGDGTTRAAFSGLVMAVPSHYAGPIRDLPGAVNPDRNRWGICNPAGNPIEHHVGHGAMRFISVGLAAFHKCVTWWYGGAGGEHQPLVRMNTSGTPGTGLSYIAMHDCAWGNGGNGVIFTSSAASPTAYTPKAYVVDNCLLEAGHATEKNSLLNFQYTNVAVKNTTIGYPQGVDLSPKISTSSDISFMGFNDGNVENLDVGGVDPFIENCTYVYRANNIVETIQDLPTSIRGFTVTHTGTTSDIDATKVIGTISPDHQ